MFNQIFKNINSSIEAIPIISSMQQSQPQKPAASEGGQEIEKLVEVVLKLLTASLSEKLGEEIDESEFKDVAADLMRSKTMQGHLIETKQKYNDLVNKSTNLYQQARKISSYIGDFISSVNVFLESEELLVPLKEIQKGINELQADKVQKQINYLVRIFQNNFEEIIEKKIRSAELSLQEEIKLLKNLNKNLETEIVNTKNNRNQDESKYFELNMKISTMGEKITKANSERAELEKALKGQLANVAEKQRILAEQEKEVNRLKQREAELLEKVRIAESKINRSERNLKEQSSESQALNLIIVKLKQKQQEIEEELERQYKKKQANSESLRKKLQNEKIYLQQRYDLLSEKYTNLQTTLIQKEAELQKLSKKIKENQERGDFEVDLEVSSKEEIKEPSSQENIDKAEQKEGTPLQGKHKISLSELMNRLSTLQSRNKQLESKLGKQTQISVNKQVFKSLFLNYDDESKEWTVRRNIKYQIYALLDLNDKIPKAQQPKQSKWFGIF